MHANIDINHTSKCQMKTFFHDKVSLRRKERPTLWFTVPWVTVCPIIVRKVRRKD